MFKCLLWKLFISCCLKDELVSDRKYTQTFYHTLIKFSLHNEKKNEINDFFSLKRRNQNEMNNTNICYYFEHFRKFLLWFNIINNDSFRTHLKRLFIYTVQIV